jgi:hypothetical protein
MHQKQQRQQQYEHALREDTYKAGTDLGFSNNHDDVYTEGHRLGEFYDWRVLSLTYATISN